jgi:hypothetical protein
VTLLSRQRMLCRSLAPQHIVPIRGMGLPLIPNRHEVRFG